MRRPLWMAVVIGLCLMACGQPAIRGAAPPDLNAQAVHAPGTLDLTFGPDGSGQVKEVLSGGFGEALKLQDDGKILLAGYTGGSNGIRHFEVARLSANGLPDLNFGTNGHALVVNGFREILTALAVQEDGKILLAGTADGQITLDRLTPGGVLDPSFGSGGQVKLSLAPSSPYFESVAGLHVRADGTILLGGSSAGRFYLVRLKSSGALDPGFGTGGVVFVNCGEPIDAFAMGVRNGAVVLLGTRDPNALPPSTSHKIHVLRLFTNGVRDPNFGAAGLSQLSFSGYVSTGAVSIQSDDRVLLAASENHYTGLGNVTQSVIARLREDGTLDPSFGTAGRITTPFGEPEATVADLKIQEGDDKILVSGDNGVDPSNLRLARYRMNGQPDAGFGVAGVVRLDAQGYSGGRMALQGHKLLTIVNFSGRRNAAAGIARFFR